MKRGYFLISAELYQTKYDNIKIIFNYFKPLEIKFDYQKNIWVIFGVSDKFDEIPNDTITPQYDIIVEKNNAVIFKRLNNQNNVF